MNGGSAPGALYEGEGRCRFTVWAPVHPAIQVRLLDPGERLEALEPGPGGWHTALVEGVEPGALYRIRLSDGSELPDPASRRQPHGVHGPSAVADPAFDWSAAAPKTVGMPGMVLYEIHVGTFTPEGTFDAIIPRLTALRDLGVTAVELMPVAAFPGERNWGYDVAYPYAVQESYGGPAGLRRLVDACHRTGLAVVLDVVYNHLGPEGSYLERFGPCFTDRYRTPWGRALNFDGPGSDEVRRFFIEAALYLQSAFRIDAFRVDAVHAIVDASARPFLQELTEAIHERARSEGREVAVIAESDLNDVKVLRPAGDGGLGFDAQWADDFHHAAHAFLTGERSGYYADFGKLGDLARAHQSAFVYAGQHSVFRGRRHGNSAEGLSPERFVASTQNHDQVGNRATGDRLAASLDSRDQRLLAALLLLSPWVPLLFMGQEYGETAPFAYFTSHSDPGLGEAVREGRRAEFAAFGWSPEAIPDPQDPATFRAATLRWESREKEPHLRLLELHRDLLRLRRRLPALARP